MTVISHFYIQTFATILYSNNVTETLRPSKAGVLRMISSRRCTCIYNRLRNTNWRKITIERTGFRVKRICLNCILCKFHAVIHQNYVKRTVLMDDGFLANSIGLGKYYNRINHDPEMTVCWYQNLIYVHMT